MEIKTGLSGRILPEDIEEDFAPDLSGRSLQKNNAPSGVKNKRALAVVFCFAGAIAGGAAVFGYNYFFQNPQIYSADNTQQLAGEKIKTEFNLVMDSDPAGASIYLDGGALSKFTPSLISGVFDGDHLMQLFYGNRKWEATVRLENGLINSLDVVIPEASSQDELLQKSGSIFLSSNPAGAKIFVNNKDIQKNTPFNMQNLNSGNYLISLTSGGFVNWSEEISISSGENLEISAILEKEKAFSESDNNINSGWRNYENKFYGIKMEFLAKWKISELNAISFGVIFEENKDDIEYNNADMLIALGNSQDVEPLIAIAVSADDKAGILDRFSGEGFKKLEEESNNFGMDIFEPAESKAERFAVFKSASNPYVFIISFHDFESSIGKDLFDNFLLAFQISKPEMF